MAIQFYLTDVGRTAALNATLVGLDLQIKHIAVGSGQYNAATAAPTKTALTTELERYLVNGGEIEPTTHTLRFTVNLNSTITADIYEIGLFDENNVLFAVASSTTTPLVQLINEVITIITFGFTLDEVDNITLMLDVNSPLAVTLMNQHTAHEHPHAQYKRINDDTERLKVANGTDPKDAVNKEQLDAEATARANADTNLQNTKAALNGDNTQRFKASMALYLDEVVNKAQLDSALSATLGSLNLGNKADKNGNSGEFFNVKNAVDSSHAVNKGQLDTEATARANADTALQNSKAELAGSSTQQFSVADGSTQYHAVNKGQLDNKAALAGSSTQQFSVANGSTQYHAVNKGQLDNKAALAGSSTQQFSVADGSTQYHAVNKGQLDALAGTIKNDLAIVNLIYPVGIVVDFSVNTNPNTIFTGTTWDRFAGGKVTVGFLSGDADFGTIGQTGGKKGHKMTLNNMIEHSHKRNEDNVSENVHTGIGGGVAGDWSGATGYIHYYTDTGITGQSNPDAIPTIPPYVVTAKWVRIS